MTRRSTIGVSVGLALGYGSIAWDARAAAPCGSIPVTSTDFVANADYQAGSRELAAAQYDEAAVFFGHLVETKACSVAPLKLLAKAQSSGGRNDAAIATYRHMLTITPVSNPKLNGAENARLLPLWNDALRDAESQLALLDPPPSAKARVVLSVRPEGAVATLGGNVVSVGAAVELDPGDVPLRVTAPGFRPHAEAVHAVAGKDLPVNVVLERYDAAACRDIEPYDAGAGAKPEDHPCNPELLLGIAETQLSSATGAEADSTCEKVIAITFAKEPALLAERWHKAQTTATRHRTELNDRTELLVHVEPADANAQVSVDLRSFERDAKIHVEPGSHRIRVTAPDYETVETTADVNVAEDKSVTVQLGAGKGNPLHAFGEVAAWVGGAAAVAGMGFGIVATLEASHASNDASLCPGRECTAEGLSYIETAHTHATIATTLLAIGLPVFAVGGALCVATAHSTGPSQTGGSLTVRGTF